MPKRYSQIGQYTIFWDEIYYIAYAGGKRELPEKDQKEWNKTLLLPYILQKQEQIKLGFENNPNLIEVKGLIIIELIKDANKIAFFDPGFMTGRRILVLNDTIVYESIRQKSYDLVAGI